MNCIMHEGYLVSHSRLHYHIAGYFRGTNFRGLLKLNVSGILILRIEIQMTTPLYSKGISIPEINHDDCQIFKAVNSRF